MGLWGIIKIKILRSKLISAFLAFLLLIATPVSANEIIRLNQFNNHLKQARDLNASEKPQEAQEALQQAKGKIHATLLVKAFKNEEIKQTEKEIEKMRQLMNERVKGVVTENLTTPTPSPSIMPTNSENSSVVLTPTPQSTVSSPTTIPTELDKEKVCRQANDLLLEIKQACDVKPFPGIDECIKNVECEIEKIENREGSLSVLDEEHLQSYGIYDRLDKQRELLIELTGLKSRYLVFKEQCGE